MLAAVDADCGAHDLVVLRGRAPGVGRRAGRRVRRAALVVPDRRPAGGPRDDAQGGRGPHGHREGVPVPAVPDRGAALLPRGLGAPPPAASRCCSRRCCPPSTSTGIPERKVAPPRHAAEARLHGQVRAPVEHAGDDATARACSPRAGSPPRCTWSATRCTTTRATPPTSGGCAPRSARSGAPAASGAGVIWHGGQPRAEAMRLAAAGDIGLSWRHPELDSSLELSTKVLEFGQLGLPVILNRTPMHEALLGADYPLFAASTRRRGGRGRLARSTRPCSPWRRLGRRRRPPSFALDKAAARLRTYLARAVRGPRLPRRGFRRAAAAAARGHRGARPEVLHAANPVLPAPAGPGGPRRPVGGARRARRGALPGTRRVGRRHHLRVVRPERRLVLAAQARAPPGCWCTCTGSSCTRPTRARSRSATSTR